MIDPMFEVTVRVTVAGAEREVRVELQHVPTGDEWMKLASDIERALFALAAREREEMQ